VAHLPVLEEAGVITWAPKNGCARDVPLSAEAVRIWEETGGRWGFDPEALDVHWRDLRLIASRIHLPVARLHFHDTRHEAISRLAKKLHPLELARMTGHNNINELLTYYDEDPAAIAMKL
jgi:integrase